MQVSLEHGRLVVDDQGPGGPSGGPGARLRAVLALRGVPRDDRLGPGSLESSSRPRTRHAGTLEVSESPGGGARFVLTLPGRPTLPAEAGEASGPPATAEVLDTEPAHSSP